MNTRKPNVSNRIADVSSLSVVIPALNEEDGIAEIVNRVLATRGALAEVGVTDLEVIVVDDGSQDATPQIVAGMDGVRLIEHAENRGYGAAIKTGFCHAQGGLLAFLDADSTYPPESFPELCRVIREGKADIAIGSRRSGAETRMPAVRRLGNWIWSLLLSLIGDSRVVDPASGMRVLRREALRSLYPLPDGLNFTPVMSTRTVHEGLRAVEIPIRYCERSGRSKLSVVRDGWRFLATIVGTALQYNPGRLLEIVGASALLLAALTGAMFVAARVQGVSELGPLGVLATFVGLVLAVGGVSAFALGIAFNSVIALAHERPVRQVSVLAKILGPHLDRHFVWVGAVITGGGLIAGACSIALGMNGWEITRIWFWLLGSALFSLVGVQLLLFASLLGALRRLNVREEEIGADMKGYSPASEVSDASAIGQSGLKTA